jgi:hypothetical protein
MAYIDSVIVNLTERCCRRFQALTGKTNVWLAVQLTNLSVVVYFAWAGLYSWSIGGAQRLLFALFCGALLYGLAQTIFRMPIEAYEAAAYRRLSKGFSNPRRVRDASLRIAFLTLSLVLGYPMIFIYISLQVRIAILSYLLVVLTTAVLYLLACDPLPPCRGRVRQWLRGAAASPVTASDLRS